MDQSQPRILFVSLSDDIGSERIVAEMSRRGALCAVLGRRDAIAAKPMRVVRHVHLPSRGGLWAAALGLARRLELLVADWRPDALVPLDDMAAGVLRDLATAARTSAALKALLARSLGDPAHYRTVSCRASLIEAAAAAGLRAPAQRRAHSLAEATAAAGEIGYPLMLKREGTCGGSGVTLVRDEVGLAEAFRAAARRARAKRALRQLFGFRSSRDGCPITLQAHVAGALAMRTVACEAGRVLDGISFRAERLDPPVTGSSTVVEPIVHPEMEAAAHRLVAALGCSGFVSLDFILSPDGGAHLIEMNARPVGSGHLGRRFGHDVYGAWLRRFPGWREDAPSDAPEAVHAVALFPKEMGRDPLSPDLAPGAEVSHDVPWDEPRVLADYGERLMLRHPGQASAIARRLAVVPEAGTASRRRRGVAPALTRFARPRS